MAKKAKKSKGPKPHKFRNKLLLNQWLISLFGIDPLVEHKVKGHLVRPSHMLAAPIKEYCQEGLDHDNLHYFYHPLVNSDLFMNDQCSLSKEQILLYEENLIRHTQAINKERRRQVVWKYYQWLTLLFVEIYLNRFFGNRESLLDELNTFVERFNRHWAEYADVPPYAKGNLDKMTNQGSQP